MENLTLQHLAPYLPYGLKCQLLENKADDFEDAEWAEEKHIFNTGAIWELIGINKSKDLNIPIGEGYLNGFLYRNGTTYCNFHRGIFPMLRPLSDLINEIEHNGKKFVPIEYHSFSHSKEEIIEFQNKFAHYKSLKYGITERLFEWHFDVFGLIEKGLAVDLTPTIQNGR